MSAFTSLASVCSSTSPNYASTPNHQISLDLTCFWCLYCGPSLLLETPYSLSSWDMLLSWYFSYFSDHYLSASYAQTEGKVVHRALPWPSSLLTLLSLWSSLINLNLQPDNTGEFATHVVLSCYVLNICLHGGSPGSPDSSSLKLDFSFPSSCTFTSLLIIFILVLTPHHHWGSHPR